MKIKAIRCMGCKTILFSRALHDFRTCFCEATSVDGGQTDYVKVCFDEKVGFENVELEIDVTKKQLYNDWNNRKDKFGLIKPKP